MSDATRAKVSTFLASHSVTFSATYTGETVKDGNWKCDGWRVSFTRAAGWDAGHHWTEPRKLETDFYTGTGHRKPSNIPTSYPAARGAKHRWEKPHAPHAADVLSSLLLDAEAVDMSFTDWCDTFGSDSDSIKARNTYDACCAIGQELRNLFLAAEREELRTMLQDF